MRNDLESAKSLDVQQYNVQMTRDHCLQTLQDVTGGHMLSKDFSFFSPFSFYLNYRWYFGVVVYGDSHLTLGSRIRVLLRKAF